MDLPQLIHGLPIRVVRGNAPRLRVCDLTEDSRSVMPGSLFVARAGLASDGTRFAADAERAGAVAILAERDLPQVRHAAMLVADDLPRTLARLAERFYGEPSSQVRVLGITGTNGKTTVAWLARALLRHAGRRCGLMGTVVVDDGRSVAPATHTTLPAIELSRSLATMREHGLTHAAIEVSSHALHQHRASGVRFAAGVFTNLTGDHLDYHGTMEDYAAAKALLFEMLPEDATAIVNADDPWHERMLRACRARVLRCGSAGEARAIVHALDTAGMDLTLEGPWGLARGRAGLIGAHNAENLLHAAAAAWAVGGLDAAALQRALPALAAPPGRFEPVPGPQGAPRVLVDYAHTDDALDRALTALRGVMPGGRLWVVFGCGGDRDRSKRPRMGRVAAERAHRVVVTSDNPRTEPPHEIIGEILAGVPAGARGGVIVHADRALAIRSAIEAAGPDDVVLIAGKGHETEQILPDGSGGTRRVPFDDRAVAAEALAERG